VHDNVRGELVCAGHCSMKRRSNSVQLSPLLSFQK